MFPRLSRAALAAAWRWLPRPSRGQRSPLRPSHSHSHSHSTWLALAVLLLAGLLPAFYVLVLPHIEKLHLHADISWYDLGVLGFYPTRNYVSFGLESPSVEFAEWDPRCDGRYTLLAPRGDSIARPGPMIVDAQGELVWMQETVARTQDFRVQKYRGEDFLTFWEGNEHNGFGRGKWRMLDSTYTQIHEIRAVGTFDGDFHDFRITEDDVALVTAYEAIPADLTSVGGPAQGWIFDSIFQEIDIETNELRFEWRASQHYPINITFQKIGDKGSHPDSAFDFFHINSVDKDPQGNYLVSGRHAHVISSIDSSSGDVRWTLGGRVNDFADASGGAATSFAWQHDARWHGNNILTLFNNAGHGAEDRPFESRGMKIELDIPNRVAELQAEYYHPDDRMSFSQGNMQVLENGNVFVSWGDGGAYSEYDANGDMLCDVHYAAYAFSTFARAVSYRVTKASWVGKPRGPPEAVVSDDAIFVSWNGATEVAVWRLEVWDGDDIANMSFNVAGRVRKTGFETVVDLPEEMSSPFFRLAALDSHGNVLGYTGVLERQQQWCLGDVFTVPFWIGAWGVFCVLLAIYYHLHAQRRARRGGKLVLEEYQQLTAEEDDHDRDAADKAV